VSSLHSKKIVALQNLLKVSPEKSLILSCDTVAANERNVCFVICTSEKRATILYKVNSLDFLTEMEEVYYAVRTGSLNKTYSVSSLRDTLSISLSRL
jgi:hypothetical protein